MNRFRLTVLILTAILLGTGVAGPTADAQDALPSGVTLEQLSEITEYEDLPSEVQEIFSTYVGSRDSCLAAYQLGSVVFLFDGSVASRSFKPGQSMTISGNIQNTNPYPIAQGKVMVRILRDDTTVAAEHWHPIVAETILPNEFNLPASDSVPFTFSWAVPNGAPGGTYRAEFHFLAGGRYSMGGLSFVPNFTAGSVLFGVQTSANPAILSFDRSSVELQNEPLALRAVPPTLAAGAPVSIQVNLTASGTSAPIPATITTALYEWSDTDGEQPLQQSSEQVSITQNQPYPVQFSWENAQAGVHELVVTATPQDSSLLPSIVRVRFPVEGNTPRVVFSGVTEVTDTEAVVTTCVVNGTHGAGAGTVTTQVASGGNTLATATGNVDSEVLSTVQTRLALADIGDALQVSTQASNDLGQVTDDHTVSYRGSDIVPPAAAQTKRPAMWLMVAIGAALLLVIIISIIVIKRHSTPPTPTPPQPL